MAGRPVFCPLEESMLQPRYRPALGHDQAVEDDPMLEPQAFDSSSMRRLIARRITVDR